MKWFYWILIFLAFCVPTMLIGKGIDHLDIMKDRYKRALDAGVNAAVEYVSYTEADSMNLLANGFGEENHHRNDIYIAKDEALQWFYRVFYRNLNIQDDPNAQANLRKYIPLKAIAAFDRIYIADLNDQWNMEEFYDIKYKDINYRFTLSERVMELNTGLWGNDIDFGISPRTREALVNKFIKTSLTRFLNNRENFESNNLYDVNIAVSDIDVKTDDIDGISFIVMVEGAPLPTLNSWNQKMFYAFSLGGSEATR